MQRLLIAVLTLAASSAAAADLRLRETGQPSLESLEIGPGHRVRISRDGSRIETEIGVAGVHDAGSGRTVVRRTQVGSSVNIATGKGAIACSDIAGRKTCVVNQGQGSRVVEGPGLDLESCFGEGTIAAIITCAERQAHGKR